MYMLQLGLLEALQLNQAGKSLIAAWATIKGGGCKMNVPPVAFFAVKILASNM
jgi:hypothetical protein